MNNQTQGPAVVHDNGYGTLHIQSPDGNTLLASVSYRTKAFPLSKDDWTLEQAKPIAALLAAAYTSYDKAGRELGIDATELAQSVDLAALIRMVKTARCNPDTRADMGPLDADMVRLLAKVRP